MGGRAHQQEAERLPRHHARRKIRQVQTPETLRHSCLCVSIQCLLLKPCSDPSTIHRLHLPTNISGRDLSDVDLRASDIPTHHQPTDSFIPIQQPNTYTKYFLPSLLHNHLDHRNLRGKQERTQPNGAWQSACPTTTILHYLVKPPLPKPRQRSRRVQLRQARSSVRPTMSIMVELWSFQPHDMSSWQIFSTREKKGENEEVED